ncbi:hypothetical protein [Streptomyces sp. YS-3]|uniref:hypothetical protein n=1 Tax=Streptomyces sp. YS-3 TaxID=3381352 RepID=UPI00386225A0
MSVTVPGPDLVLSVHVLSNRLEICCRRGSSPALENDTMNPETVLVFGTMADVAPELVGSPRPDGPSFAG